MAVRPIDASRFGEILEQWKKDCLQDNDTQGADIISDVILQLDDMPTLTPPNEPLTLEQLREMNGEPVYIIASDMGIAEWNVIAGKEWITVAYDVPRNGFKAVVEGVGFINGRAFRIDSYGTDWFAYRRPAEGEEDT